VSGHCATENHRPKFAVRLIRSTCRREHAGLWQGNQMEDTILYRQRTLQNGRMISGSSETWYRSGICRVLTMVYNTQDYRDSGLCLSSGILKTGNHKVSENGSVSVLRWGEGQLLCWVPFVRSLWLTLSKGPSRVDVSTLLTWGRKQIRFPKRCVF
jgi:hypothetical protein